MKDIFVRAAKTFIQAALGYICTVSLIDIDWNDKTVVAGLIIAAVSAGLSALMNIDWNAVGTTKKEDDANEAD